VELAPGEWFPGVNPLREATTVEEIENYPGWPDMDDPSRVAHVREQALALKEQGEYAIMGTPWLLFPFERAFAMQGMDVFLLNMGANPDLADALLGKITDQCKALMANFLHECGDLIDIIKIGDDLGTQSNLMISPKMYRHLLKPYHADLIALIKEQTAAKVFFHTDGDVFNLFDDFVEIGIDILNPIQTSAGSMANLPEIKRRYGTKLAYCGAIDTHRVLPYGTPQEVREEVRRVIDILGPGGGYMVASVHTIMNDVPAKNILAMVDAVEEYGSYPLA
jgi:uroporphyrinogen decarboxylase